MTFKQFKRALASLVAVIAISVSPSLRAADLTVLSSGGRYDAALKLAPGFEKETGHRVTVESASSMGGGATSIPLRLERKEKADLLLMVTYALEELVAKGVVAQEGKLEIADSLIGMAVREGAPKPDISALDAFKKTLLDAKSIAYSGSASGVYIEAEMYKLLGLEAALKPKSQKIISIRVGDIVAKGEAEIGFQQVSELLPIKGIAYVGVIPKEVQKVTRYSAGIPIDSKEAAAARQLIAYIAGPVGRPVVKATGLEPLTGN